MRHTVERGLRALMEEHDIPDQHPLDALLEVVRVSGMMVRLLTSLVSELEVHPGTEDLLVGEDGTVIRSAAMYGPKPSTGDAAPHVLVEMLGSWSERSARASKLALDAKIDERLVRQAESTSARMYEAITRALVDVGLTESQERALRSALARELRATVGIPPTMELTATLDGGTVRTDDDEGT